MSKMPLRAKGNQGNWFVKVDGEDIPCLLAMWLKMPQYHDPHAKPGEPKWDKYVAALRALNKAALTKNALDGTYKRDGYIGIFEITNVAFDQEGLRCAFVSRLENLK
jgi:hypothetical protein